MLLSALIFIFTFVFAGFSAVHESGEKVLCWPASKYKLMLPAVCPETIFTAPGALAVSTWFLIPESKSACEVQVFPAGQLPAEMPAMLIDALAEFVAPSSSVTVSAAV